MKQEELASLCTKEWQAAEMYMPEIQAERMKALDYYNQEPFGNEEDGLSKFVSSDVRDAVEWTLPQLVEIFVGGDTPIIFEAENAEDAKDAEIESKYCQYVFTRQNKGVLIAYSWIKDALLQKNGIVKAYWDEPTIIEREEYKNKTLSEYMAIQQDDEFEIKEVSVFLNEIEYSEEEFQSIIDSMATMDPAAAANIADQAKISIVGTRKRTVGQIRVENVPPENFMCKKGHNSILLKDAQYAAEMYEKTRSDLIEEGYSADLVNSLPKDQKIEVTNNESQSRHKKEGGLLLSQSNTNDDPAMDVIVIYDHYIRADFNGDGVAELRLVRTVGKSGDYVLENEECDRIPYHAITPYINTHKFYGRSIADNLADLQRAKSQLWRNAFDNFMYSSLPRKVVSGNVNMDDLMSYIPGGIIRKDINATLETDAMPFVANEAFPMIDRLDAVRAERSGFSKDTMGLNPDALANSTNMVGMSIMAQSQLLVKMIATVIAHTGFDSLMLHIREMVRKYETKERVFDLTGEVLTTDPRGWRKERSSSPQVGIGFAGKAEEMTMLQNLLSLQEKAIAAQGGVNGALTSASGVFNTVKRLARRMGIKDVSNYFQDPSTYQPPEPQPSLGEIQLKATIEDLRNKNKQTEANQALKLQEMKTESEFRFAELTQKERLTIKDIESRERIAELELLYKYGKDSHDRNQNALNLLNSVSDEKEDAEEGEMPEKEESPDKE